jgi:hypothetical protein
MPVTPKTSPRFNPEQFKDHVVDYYTHNQDLAAPLEMLVWRKPGTRTGYIRFVRVGHELFVSGDWYNACYSWSETAPLTWMADTNFGYFHGKCTASRLGVPAQEWDLREFVRLGVHEVRIATANRWDEPDDEITDEHPMIKTWHAINNLRGPCYARNLSEFMEENMPDVLIEQLPGKYRGDMRVTDCQVPVGTFFFGRHWRECVPNGYLPDMVSVIHHGALRMAVQWLRNNKPKTWETMPKEA